MKMKFRKRVLPALVAALFAGNGMRASANANVVAATPELGAIARELGGDKVSVYAVARPNSDYHTVEPRPSDVARVGRADLVIRVGMGLDMWLDALSNASGVRRIRPGGAGYVDASQSVPRIEVPTGQISGASGDVHPDGNPHYYYDPVYAKFAARNIVRGLIRVDAANAATYRANYTRFNRTIDAKMVEWRRQLAPYTGRPVMTYHRSFNYFLRRFGIRQYGTLEPRPGIPPSAGHVQALIGNMKRDRVRAILVESIYPKRFPQLVANQLGVRYVVGPYSVSSMNQGAYFNLLDTLVDRLRQAVSQ
ncbi:MAG TPA: metal ABC transporter substrate-binding protein [Abditibacteriaceae bacterium]